MGGQVIGAADLALADWVPPPSQSLPPDAPAAAIRAMVFEPSWSLVRALSFAAAAAEEEAYAATVAEAAERGDTEAPSSSPVNWLAIASEAGGSADPLFDLTPSLPSSGVLVVVIDSPVFPVPATEPEAAEVDDDGTPLGEGEEAVVLSLTPFERLLLLATPLPPADSDPTQPAARLDFFGPLTCLAAIAGRAGASASAVCDRVRTRVVSRGGAAMAASTAT